MDGDTLSRDLQMLLNETSGSLYLDAKSTYDYLYWAAIDTVMRTNALVTYQDITTVASTASYDLEPDFLKLYLTDDNNRFFVRYYDGTSYYFLYYESYDSIVLANNTTAVTIPSRFTIRQGSEPTQVTGTATSAGTATYGESILTDTAGLFTTTDDVSVGDVVHNATDGSQGVVEAVTDATHLQTTLFGGTDNDWTSSDVYRINPQTKFVLQLDPPPSTASHTVRVYYVQKPYPVYSDYRKYNLPINYRQPLVQYAAWLYRYRDREPNFGDAFFKYWDRATRQYGKELNTAMQKRGYRVNLIKRAGSSWSYK